MSVDSSLFNKPIDQIFPVNPRYEHLFSGKTYCCTWRLDTGFKVAVVRPYIQEGYWHCNVMDCSGSLEDYLTKASCRGLVTNFLELHDVPFDESKWEVTDIPPANKRNFVEASIPQKQFTKSEDRTNVVYFVKAGGFVKIGFTSKPVALRINEFKTGCPYHTELLGTIEGGMSVERALHRQFAHLRSSGEWFIASDELISFISERIEP